MRARQLPGVEIDDLLPCDYGLVPTTVSAACVNIRRSRKYKKWEREEPSLEPSTSQPNFRRLAVLVKDLFARHCRTWFASTVHEALKSPAQHLPVFIGILLVRVIETTPFVRHGNHAPVKRDRKLERVFSPDFVDGSA